MSKGFFFGKEKRHRKSAAEREREREVYLRTGRSPLSPVVCVCVRAPEKENVWWYESQKSRTDAALSKSAQSLILDERASAWIPLVIPPAYLHNRLFRALHLFLYGRSFSSLTTTADRVRVVSPATTAWDFLPLCAFSLCIRVCVPVGIFAKINKWIWNDELETVITLRANYF